MNRCSGCFRLQRTKSHPHCPGKLHKAVLSCPLIDVILHQLGIDASSSVLVETRKAAQSSPSPRHIRPKTCPHCGAQFAAPSDLAAHVKQHLPSSSSDAPPSATAAVATPAASTVSAAVGATPAMTAAPVPSLPRLSPPGASWPQTQVLPVPGSTPALIMQFVSSISLRDLMHKARFSTIRAFTSQLDPLISKHVVPILDCFASRMTTLDMWKVLLILPFWLNSCEPRWAGRAQMPSLHSEYKRRCELLSGGRLKQLDDEAWAENCEQARFHAG